VHVEIALYSLVTLEDSEGPAEKNILQNISVTEEVQELQLTGITQANTEFKTDKR
jgi:hypothetical protein